MFYVIEVNPCYSWEAGTESSRYESYDVLRIVGKKNRVCIVFLAFFGLRVGLTFMLNASGDGRRPVLIKILTSSLYSIQHCNYIDYPDHGSYVSIRHSVESVHLIHFSSILSSFLYLSSYIPRLIPTRIYLPLYLHLIRSRPCTLLSRPQLFGLLFDLLSHQLRLWLVEIPRETRGN